MVHVLRAGATYPPGDSHGDIVLWPVLALFQYLVAGEDATLLEEVVPFFHAEGDAQAERGSIRQHVERALAVIRNRLIPGTHLAAYGYGDWNDSLQPADPSMRERLCSAWTVTLHYQTLTALAAAFRRLAWPEPAAHYEAMAAQVREDFQRLLVYAVYGRALHGDIPLDGGWRIYSSGAGIGMRLILRCFLGMRREQRLLVIDPVIPASLDGLQVELELAGRAFEVIYRIAGAGCGPTAVNLNGADLPFSRGANPYRIGAAAVPMEAVLARLMDGVNRLCIQVG